jgi:hypothetical protein
MTGKSGSSPDSENGEYRITFFWEINLEAGDQLSARHEGYMRFREFVANTSSQDLEVIAVKPSQRDEEMSRAVDRARELREKGY